MPSRGVVFGDVNRANEAWNERLQALAEHKGIDLGTPGAVGEIGDDVSGFLQGDIWDKGEAELVLADLVHSYTGITVKGPLLELLLGLALHAGAIGVLTERQRWETTA